MSNSKNYFKSDEAKEKSKYKLWILYKSEYKEKFKGNPKTYYGFNTKSDGGLAGLINLAEDRKDMFNLAILYDNQAADREHSEVRRWENRQVQPKNIDRSALKRKRPRITRPVQKRTW